MTGGPPPSAFLEPAVLARISDLALLARTVVDGFMHGLHRSSRMGLSLDFAVHRPYQPGDDIRRIDWRAYGRTDRYYVKEYEADTNASVMFALDASESMDFGSGAITKFHYGRCLVAALAWLAQRQGDRVGLVTFTGDLGEVVPPSTRHLNLLLLALGRARPEGPGGVPQALERVARIATRSGIVVLVSDCYEDPMALAKSVGTLRARGHDVLVFHVIDAAERDLPWTTPVTFEDAETGARMPLRPDELRPKYRRLVESHRRDLAQGLAGAGADYDVVETDRPLDQALYAFLDRRLATSRLR